MCDSVARPWEAELEDTLVSGASRSSSALSIVAVRPKSGWHEFVGFSIVAVSEIVLWVRVDGA